ncbi:hypothetical protein [Halomonas sp. N3-2A]|uniref:hypothetical protein n=1 Tax=Halomonas sp. N3-2A TaxID=2014541 RepID=UPI000B5B2198|nr:hypothetical protein [Halomonas sp. N3-2A]ASK20708.1 hypothetical protein CEK60_16020 [Halomonas sp. N3-2A]
MTNSVTFPVALGGDGKTYTDDADPETGLDGLGYTSRFIPCLRQAVAMAGYTAKYAAKIDAAAANADRAEDAKRYVEAVAEAYKVNLLEQFKRDATLGLDFVEGRYWKDDGERFETTDFTEIGTIDSITDIYVEGVDGNLQAVPAGKIARQWRDGTAVGKVSGDASTNTAAYSNDPDNWNLTSGALIESIEIVNGISRATVRLPTQTEAAVAFPSSLASDGLWTISARIKILEGWDDSTLVASMGGASPFREFVDPPPENKWGWIQRTETVLDGSGDARIIRRIDNNAPDIVIVVEAQQVEAGPIRSPYIPVQGAISEARSARSETINFGSAVNPRQGSIIFKAQNIKPDSVSDFGRLFQFDDGTSDNRIYVIRRSSGAYSFYILSGGVQQNEFVSKGGMPDELTLVLSWQDNGQWFVCANGDVFNVKNSIQAPLALNRFGPGSSILVDYMETEYLYYVPTPMSQSEAIEVTQQ